MSRYFIKSITIEGFRGINNDGDPLVLKFKPKAVNSIHAPNGVGKTSIFEALHFAIFGTVPRLQELQEAEQGSTYVVNKFHSSQQATIALVFSSDDGTDDVSIVVARNASGGRTVTSPNGASEPEKFLASLQEDFVLVDYSRFAKFIDASPLDRGRSFASLVGLSRYSRLRQTLESAKRTQNINSDLSLSSLETLVASEKRAIDGIDRRIIAAHNEITGIEATILEDHRTLVSAVTSAIADIPLVQPFLAERSILDLDFGAAEKAIETEEGGAA